MSEHTEAVYNAGCKGSLHEIWKILGVDNQDDARRALFSLAERAEGEVVAWRWREHYNAAHRSMMHLWEVNHPYYMTEGNYFQSGCHTEYKTWASFVDEFGDSDLDCNWFVRWDWLEGEDNGAGTYNGDDYYRHARFMLQLIGQRKAKLLSFEVEVCRADEPEILAFLEPRWAYMQEMWAPFAPGRAAPALSASPKEG